MKHRRFFGTLATLAMISGFGVHAHEVWPVCGLAVVREEGTRDAFALDVELARSRLVAAQEVFELLADLWEGEATERMRYLDGKHERDAAKADLDRKTAWLARGEAYLTWLKTVCAGKQGSTSGDFESVRREAEERYAAAECEVRRCDVEVARVDQEWSAIWLESIRDLREHSVATRPDVIEAEYGVHMAEQRMQAALARVRQCEPSTSAPGSAKAGWEPPD